METTVGSVQTALMLKSLHESLAISQEPSSGVAFPTRNHVQSQLPIAERDLGDNPVTPPMVDGCSQTDF